MKRVVLSLICSCIFVGAMAQKDLTSVQKSFQSSIVSFLREEGYSPSIDSDGWIAFKSEGDIHYVRVYRESPFFIIFSRRGFTIGGEKGYKFASALWSCNTVNRELEAVKMYCSDTVAFVQIELYVRSAEDFKYVFYKNISSLAKADKMFIEKYREYEKE